MAEEPEKKEGEKKEGEKKEGEKKEGEKKEGEKKDEEKKPEELKNEVEEENGDKILIEKDKNNNFNFFNEKWDYNLLNPINAEFHQAVKFDNHISFTDSVFMVN